MRPHLNYNHSSNTLFDRCRQVVAATLRASLSDWGSPLDGPELAGRPEQGNGIERGEGLFGTAPALEAVPYTRQQLEGIECEMDSLWAARPVMALHR